MNLTVLIINGITVCICTQCILECLFKINICPMNRLYLLFFPVLCTRFSLVIYFMHAAAAAKSLQSCPTLCDPIDVSPPGSPTPGILQARTLEWLAISFSNAWKGQVKGKLLSGVRLFVTPWTAAHQAPPSMGFSRQEYWSGVPLPSRYLIPTYYWLSC